MTPEEVFVLEFVSTHTGNSITTTQDLFDIGGLDSLDYMELLEAITNRFHLGNLLFELDDWNRIRTAEGIARAVSSN